MLHINLALIGQVVSEKINEYYGDIHVYCPGLGAYEPLASIFFRIFNILSYCPFTLNAILKVFPHSNALATYVDIAV